MLEFPQCNLARALSILQKDLMMYKLINIVVPFPAGGDLEPAARAIGDHFQEVWKQPYIVDFKAGEQAMIGTDYVARSQPDGHTLLICSVRAMTINPKLYEKVPYTVGKDIVPVSRDPTSAPFNDYKRQIISLLRPEVAPTAT